MSEQQSKPPSRAWSSADDQALTPLYKLAYDEGKRALTDQLDELNGMRTKAVQFIAFVSTATAFLAGFGLRNTDRTLWFFLIAGAASALSLMAIFYLARILSPRIRNLSPKLRRWVPKIFLPKGLPDGEQLGVSFTIEANVIMDDWIRGRELPRRCEWVLLEEITHSYVALVEGNKPLVDQIRRNYGRMIVLGALGVITWAGLAWLGGAAQ